MVVGTLTLITLFSYIKILHAMHQFARRLSYTVQNNYENLFTVVTINVVFHISAIQHLLKVKPCIIKTSILCEECPEY